MSPVDHYLPFGLTLEALIAYGVGLLTFISMVIAWQNEGFARP
jgi:hypothetical protein